jgi:hypothetical protein
MPSSRGASVFSPRNFDDFGNPDAVIQALSRLIKADKIRWIRWRLYDWPRQYPIVGQTAPDIMATVRALMDGSQAQWQFSRAYAANALGLSDQVPAKIVILTNAAPRRVSLGKLMFVFRRTAPRNLQGAGRPPGLVVQALRHLQTDPNLSRHVAHLKKRLDAKTKADSKSLAPKTPARMRPILQQIRPGRRVPVFSTSLKPPLAASRRTRMPTE